MLLITFSSLYILSVFIFSHYASLTYIPKAVAIIMGVCFILESIHLKKQILPLNLCHILFALWIAIGFMAGVIAGTGSSNFYGAWTVLQVFLASLILYGTIMHRLSIRWLAFAVVAGVLISSAGVDLNILPGFEDTEVLDSQRFSGTMANANLFGYCCVTAIAFIFYLWKRHHQIVLRVGFTVIAGYLVIKIADSGSRKAILGILALIGIEYLIYVFRQSFRLPAVLKVSAATMVALVIVGSFWFLVVNKEKSYVRIRNLGHFIQGEALEGGEQSLYGRLQLFHKGLNLFYENPVIGTGFKSFSEAKMHELIPKEIGTYSHSNYIEVLVSSGLLGFLVYYSMYVIIFIKAIYIIKSNKVYALNEPSMHFVIFFLFYSLFFDFFAVTYYVKEFWIFFTALLGSIALLEHAVEKQLLSIEGVPEKCHKVSHKVVSFQE